MDNAFCFGNGKSRLDFDMKVIEGRGTTFGCNAIYRDMVVDHLITVDNEITHEIYRSGYCQDNQTHIRDWNVLPMYFLDDMKNDYQDADICIGRDDVGFVIHGSNTADVEAHFQKIVYKRIQISTSRNWNGNANRSRHLLQVSRQMTVQRLLRMTEWSVLCSVDTDCL